MRAETEGFDGGLGGLKALGLGGGGELGEDGLGGEFGDHMALGADEHVASVALGGVGAADVGIQAGDMVDEADMLQKFEGAVGDGGVFVIHLGHDFGGGEGFVALPEDLEDFFALRGEADLAFGAALLGFFEGLVLTVMVLARVHNNI